MCVIIYKPAGVPMPSKDILTACYHANSDGVGFCTPNAMFKGTDVNSILRELSKVKTCEPCLIHFRFATHGSVCDANCHPFANNKTYFMHNGVLSIRPVGDMTDSETAFRKYIVPRIEKYGLSSKSVELAVNKMIGGSKFAFMQGYRVYLFGRFESYEGCLYSNLRWQYHLDRLKSFNSVFQTNYRNNYAVVS